MRDTENSMDRIDREKDAQRTALDAIAVQKERSGVDFDTRAADAAYARLRERAQSLHLGSLDGATLNEWRDEGRR
jgi:hypothetical protein